MKRGQFKDFGSWRCLAATKSRISWIDNMRKADISVKDLLFISIFREHIGPNIWIEIDMWTQLIHYILYSLKTVL